MRAGLFRYKRRFMRSSRLFFSLLAMCLFLALLPGENVSAADRLQQVDGKPVIVIDPGHGGDNMGTQSGGIWDEKYMTMVTAQAMYDELCLYDDVEVYLTRTEDREVSFVERAEFAESVGADFLFSIHYNASDSHELFGSEVWVPLTAPFNNYGYQVAYELLTGMRERGLFIRGIKTRKGDRGEYYAIIREPFALDIPAVIIEHCHVDEERDRDYCDTEEDLIRFGREDATAVAKYFGLKSSILNVDYSDHQLVEVNDTVPVASTLQDETEPDVCVLELSEADYHTGYLSFTLSAADYDSPILYYSYSLDGGETYSPKNVWPDSDALTGKYTDTFTLSLTVPDGTQPSVIVRAYNKFELYTESNRYDCPNVFSYNDPAGQETASQGGTADAAGEGGENASGTEETGSERFSGDGEETAEPSSVEALSGSTASQEEKSPSFLTFLKLCLAFVIILMLVVLVSQTIAAHQRRRRRRRR